VDEPNLRRAALVAGVAEGVVATALPLLAASITRDPLAIAAVVAAQHLPWIVVALGWPLVGRIDRRTVVGLVHTMRSLAVAYLGLQVLASTDTILQIQLVALVVGLGEALSGVVEDEAGDSRLSTRGMWGVALVGMPLGGVLYEVFAAVPFLMDVLFFALAALFALFVPRPVRAPAAEREPIRWPRLAPGTGPVALTALLASAARSAVLGVLVLFALVDLGLGAPAWGLLLAGLAAATAAGGFVAPETGSALGLKAGFVVAAAVSGVALVVAARVADAERPWTSAVALGIAWATATTGAVLLRALLPAAAGRPVTDGALRAFHLAEWVGVCGGALAGGWWARDHGVAGTVQAAAAGWALAAVAVLLVRRRAAETAVENPPNKLLDAA
jgi:hypothetical protein